jgi:hypothetical protein
LHINNGFEAWTREENKFELTLVDQEDLHTFLICLPHLRPEQSLKPVNNVTIRFSRTASLSLLSKYVLSAHNRQRVKQGKTRASFSWI